jgi:hypothetical protein
MTYHDPLTPAERAWADDVRQAADRAWETGGLGAYQEVIAPLVALVGASDAKHSGQINETLDLMIDVELDLHGKGTAQEVGHPRLCACGCGEAVPMAGQTDRRSGAVAGKAGRYVHGHNPRKRLIAGEVLG